MTTFMEIEVTCPCCQAKFETHVLTSTNTFGGQTTDFHARAVGFEPLTFMVATCPACGFSASSGGFQRRLSISGAVREKIESELRPLLHSMVLTTAMQYEFAARIAEWRGDIPERIADWYLRAAWCATDAGDAEAEGRYRRAAIDYFTRTLDFEVLPDDRRLTLTYLVGELYRRLGEQAAAREWFDRAVNEAAASDDKTARQMGDLARRQRDDPQDMF